MPPVAMMPQRRVKGAMVGEVVEGKSEEGRHTKSRQSLLSQVPLPPPFLGRSLVVILGECHVSAMSGRRSCREQYRAVDRSTCPRHVMVMMLCLRNLHATSLTLPRRTRRAQPVTSARRGPASVPGWALGRARSAHCLVSSSETDMNTHPRTPELISSC